VTALSVKQSFMHSTLKMSKSSSWRRSWR